MAQILPVLPPKHDKGGGFAKMAPFARDASEMTDLQQDALQMQQGMHEDSPDLIKRMSQTYHLEQDQNQKIMFSKKDAHRMFEEPTQTPKIPKKLKI